MKFEIKSFVGNGENIDFTVDVKQDNDAMVLEDAVYSLIKNNQRSRLDIVKNIGEHALFDFERLKVSTLNNTSYSYDGSVDEEGSLIDPVLL